MTPGMTPELRDAVLRTLWPDGDRSPLGVWAVLDCARDPRIYLALLESRLEFRCLYSGKLPRALEMVAPHLVELLPGHRLTARLIDDGWGQSWGVFVKVSDASNLRHHLRKFLKVADAQGRPSIFRFYDPRVLRVFLPSCDAAQRRDFFGPVESWCCESRDAGTLLDMPALGDGGAVSRAPGVLVVRSHQVRLFEEALLRDQLERHLRAHFGDLCAALTVAALQDLVDQGIEQARRHGFRSPPEIFRYAAMVLVFGIDFEHDPAHAWAAEILADRAVPSAAMRLDLLHDAALDQLRRVPAQSTVPSPVPSPEQAT